MPSKEVVTFWLDMGAPISLLSRSLVLSNANALPRLSHARSSRTRRRPPKEGLQERPRRARSSWRSSSPTRPRQPAMRPLRQANESSVRMPLFAYSKLMSRRGARTVLARAALRKALCNQRHHPTKVLAGGGDPADGDAPGRHSGQSPESRGVPANRQQVGMVVANRPLEDLRRPLVELDSVSARAEDLRPMGDR
jgi:hypothetical protein